MVSQDLSSAVVCWWVPLHIDGVVCGLHYSGGRRSRRGCRAKERSIFSLTCTSIWTRVSSSDCVDPTVQNEAELTQAYRHSVRTDWSLGCLRVRRNAELSRPGLVFSCHPEDVGQAFQQTLDIELRVRDHVSVNQ